jgi:2-oxo-3-hexenedioate decarboxylase
MIDVRALAEELSDAYASRTPIPPPSTRSTRFDLADAYAVEAELVNRRRAAGRRTVGLKVGYANKAVWRVMKLDTLVWAHMYDNTVRMAANNEAELPTGTTTSPKIEPEIVFKLKAPIGAATEPADVVAAVEWIAIGFEIIDCVFPGWTFQPADFVAAYGLHAGLVVGQPTIVKSESIPELLERLARFSVRLLKNGEVAAEGSGRNSLRSPALCLAELAAALARRTGAEPLADGDLISSGTLTESQPMAAGDTWRVDVDGLALPSLTLYAID